MFLGKDRLMSFVAKAAEVIVEYEKILPVRFLWRTGRSV